MIPNFFTSFQSLLSKKRFISNGENKRVVIVKNNRFEAVMITVEEYEKMSEAVSILEKIYASTKRQ